MIKELLNKFSFALVPRRCPLCGDVVAFDENRCEACNLLYKIKGEICNSCGCEKDACTCKKNKNDYASVIAPYYFQGNIIHAIHRFKLYGFKELSPELAGEIVDVVNERYDGIRFDYVTYVPMTKRRTRKRGYNQSLLLAEDVANKLDVPLLHALKKIYETKPQRGSSAKERAVNLYGSFDIDVPINDVNGKTFLLVDDVKTTGSTLKECSAVLKGYGADKVYCATIAITKKEETK